VTKINSHPGVRTDLFKRSLDKTRITDFFGGVAQVEIVPPLDIAAMTTVDEISHSNSDSEKKGKGKDDNQSQEPMQLRSDVPSDPMAPKEPSITSPSILVKLLNWTGEKEWKNARAWVSVTFLGLLVSWAASKH
jgi:phosphatidylinositol glycan class K